MAAPVTMGIDRHAPRARSAAVRQNARPSGRGQGELYKNVQLPYRAAKHCRKAERPPFRAGRLHFSTRGALIASQHKVEEVKNFIGLDSLCYLSLSGMLEATGLEENGFCLACFDGKYPLQPDEDFSKLCLE